MDYIMVLDFIIAFGGISTLLVIAGDERNNGHKGKSMALVLVAVALWAQYQASIDQSWVNFAISGAGLLLFIWLFQGVNLATWRRSRHHY